MFGHFRHDHIRRYLAAFGSLFKNIEITREASTTEVQRLVVPVEHAAKDRWLVRLTKQPDFTQGVSQVLPRMAFEVTNIQYDASRKLNTLNPLVFSTAEQRRLARLYVGVPYTIKMQLHIAAKFQEDGLQILEQILPYFTPDLQFALNVIPALGHIVQIPVVLQGVGHQDTYEDQPENRRMILWTLDFNMQVFFYGPHKSSARIQEVLVDIFTVPTGETFDGFAQFETEDNQLIETEDEGGFVADESTANTYLLYGKTARIRSVLDPVDQIPSDDPQANTTITEYPPEDR